METLDARKQQALFMMLGGEKYTVIAQALNVSTRTLRRWVQEPQFAAELKDESEAVGNIMRAQSAALSGANVESGFAALKLLNRVLKSEGALLSDRMRAAGQLLNHSYKWAVQIQKMEQIEQRAQAQSETPRDIRREMKEALQAEAEQTVGGTVAETGQKRTEADIPAEQTATAPASATVPTVPSVPNVPPSPEKADKTGQKRTPQDEYQARRARLEQRDREMEAQKRAANVA
jgi:hypothetical protein